MNQNAEIFASCKITEVWKNPQEIQYIIEFYQITSYYVNNVNAIFITEIDTTCTQVQIR